MAAYITQTKFAQVCEISRQAVSQAVKQGRIVLTNGRVDTRHPTNKYFQAAAKKSRRSRRRGQVTKEENARAVARAAAKAAGEPPPQFDEPAAIPSSGPKTDRRRGNGKKEKSKMIQGVLTDLGLQETDASAYRNQIEALKMAEQTKSQQLKNEEARNKLIARSIVKQYFGELYTVETTELLTLGERLAPEIASVFGLDDQGAVLDVSKYIKKELSKTLEHIELTMDRFLKTFQVDET